MAWASWTTVGIHAAPGTVRAEEAGQMQGDLTIHTTWSDDEVQVAVQYTGSSDWFTMSGSPVPCHSEEESRAFHQGVVEAVRAGADGRASLQALFRTD